MFYGSCLYTDKLTSSTFYSHTGAQETRVDDNLKNKLIWTVPWPYNS